MVQNTRILPVSQLIQKWSSGPWPPDARDWFVHLRRRTRKAIEAGHLKPPQGFRSWDQPNAVEQAVFLLAVRLAGQRKELLDLVSRGLSDAQLRLYIHDELILAVAADCPWTARIRARSRDLVKGAFDVARDLDKTPHIRDVLLQMHSCPNATFRDTARLLNMPHQTAWHRFRSARKLLRQKDRDLGRLGRKELQPFFEAVIGILQATG